MSKQTLQLSGWLLAMAILFQVFRDPTRSLAQVNPPRHEERAGLPYRPTNPTSLAGPQVAGTSLVSWSRLVFQSYRDGNWEIYYSNDDGTAEARLTNSSEPDIQPVLNRGATLVAYAAKAGDYEIRLMKSDGDNNVALTDNSADDVYPAWSPNGYRLAFQTYRDGQAEIYVMQSDGSLQTRLTNWADYDGEPAWSPDGSKIAFVSRRNGQYRIWVMNADGSGQVQLSSQSYSSNPAWSPDGTKIAYDADGNGDGWQELWVMNADGSNQHNIVSPASSTDFLAGAWSPDSRHVGFTQIAYIFYEGQWYWTSAVMRSWDSLMGAFSTLGSTYEDIGPDWQTADAAPPVTGMAPLAAQSAAWISLHWAGYDEAGSGLRGYDVQVRDGLGGQWLNWMMLTPQTSGAYWGMGGHTYYFRVRAWDYANNAEAWPAQPDAVTTIEALPPTSAVQPVPAYARGDLTVQWAGFDPGESGIQAYEVQYRIGSSLEWHDWLTNTTATEASFHGTSGLSYSFRMRAVDLAQNTENWPAGDDAGPVTFYDWTLTGSVRDNAGAPVGNAQVGLTPAGLDNFASDRQGAYQAYALDTPPTYNAQWTKAGYGDLPPTSFPTSQDGELGVILPPLDNVVQNSGFENGLNTWAPGGLYLPQASDSARHTGSQGVALGGTVPLFTPAVNIAAGASAGMLLRLTRDASGGLHVLWSGDGLRYVQRMPDGTWSAPELVPIPETGWFVSNINPALLVDSSGAVHVLYRSGPYPTINVFHVYRPPNGVWSQPQNITNSTTPTDLIGAVIDAAGRLHVVWSHNPPAEISPLSRFNYRVRQVNGLWSPSQLLATIQRPWLSDAVLVGDPAGTLYLAWVEKTYTYGENCLYFAHKPADGVWSTPQVIAGSEYAEALTAKADPAGHAHLLYVDRAPTGWGLRYLRLEGRRTLDDTRRADIWYWHELEVDSGGMVHIVAGSSTGACALSCYLSRSGGVWSEPQALGHWQTNNLELDPDGGLHLAWLWTNDFGKAQLYYQYQSQGGAWSEPLAASEVIDSVVDATAWIALGSEGAVNLLYATPSAIYHTRSTLADQPITSQIAQQITLPAAPAVPRLSFVYTLAGASLTTGSGLKVSIQTGDRTTIISQIAQNQTHWTQHSVDLSPWAGQTVTLTVSAEQPIGTPYVRATLDEITAGSSYPDVWAYTPGLALHPGQRGIYTLSCGNQGGAAAAEVTLTFTLPNDLSLVAASRPPTLSGPDLVWSLGSIAPQSGPTVITLTVQAAIDLPIPSNLSHELRVQTVSPELETLNNSQVVTTFIPYHLVYLPMANR